MMTLLKNRIFTAHLRLRAVQMKGAKDAKKKRKSLGGLGTRPLGELGTMRGGWLFRTAQELLGVPFLVVAVHFVDVIKKRLGGRGPLAAPTGVERSIFA
jgi:hypothetical protein